MIGTMTNVSGIVVGFLLPMIFINEYDDISDLTPTSKPKYEKQIFNMMIFMAGFTSLILILVIFTFREKPRGDLFSFSRS